MKWKRSSLEFVIVATAGASAAHLLSLFLQLPAELVVVISVLTFAVTAWMVVRILKDPHSTDKTFGDQFYQERDDIRRSGHG